MSKLIPALFLFVALTTPSLFGQNAPRDRQPAAYVEHAKC